MCLNLDVMKRLFSRECKPYTIYWNISVPEIFLAKMIIRRCIILSLNPICAICMDLNGDLSLRLFFAERNFSDLEKVVNLVKLNPYENYPMGSLFYLMVQGHGKKVDNR